MIHSVRAEIVCDKCGSAYTICTNSLTKVRIKARQKGWYCDEKDLCPNCMNRPILQPIISIQKSDEATK
jgi:hypothetical protein